VGTSGCERTAATPTSNGRSPLVVRLRAQSESTAVGEGSSCLRFNTGANRSPCSRTRWSTACGSNSNRPARLFLSASSASCHASGVGTNGLPLARREYAVTVVLCASFWLQVGQVGGPYERGQAVDQAVVDRAPLSLGTFVVLTHCGRCDGHRFS